MIIKHGDRNPSVKTLQENLIELGYGKIVGKADGIFGDGTEAGVKAFQKANNLTVDGVAGPNTLSKLQAILKPENRKVKESTSVDVTFAGKKIRVQLSEL